MMTWTGSSCLPFRPCLLRTAADVLQHMWLIRENRPGTKSEAYHVCTEGRAQVPGCLDRRRLG